MDMRVGLWRTLSAEELMLLNGGVGEHLRVPWTARRSNRSILKEVILKYSLEGLIWSWNSNTWPPDAKNWLIGKDPVAGKDWRQEEKGMTEDEMVWWHHQLNGREFKEALGACEGQGSLACCSPWGCKESDITEWLNNNNHYCIVVSFSFYVC